MLYHLYSIAIRKIADASLIIFVFPLVQFQPFTNAFEMDIYEAPTTSICLLQRKKEK